MNKENDDERAVNRSYARILWRNEMLGLQMINVKGRQFFIYADPLVSLFRNQNHYVRVKRRDNDPEKSWGHHPGEIYGIMELCEDELTSNNYYMLTLSFGSAEKMIKMDKVNGGLLEVIEEQEYLFPKKELSCLIRSIEIMQVQQSEFKKLTYKTDVMVI